MCLPFGRSLIRFAIVVAIVVPCVVFGLTQVTLADSSDDLEPLRGFVAEMDKNYPDPDTRADFHAISVVLGAAACSPHDVQEAVNQLKTQASADHCILASFKSLTQGKRFMELALEVIEGKMHLVKTISTLDEIAKRCEAHTSAMPGLAMEAAIKAFSSECGSLKAASSQIKPDDAASKKALTQTNSHLQEFAVAMLKHHISQEGCPYLKIQSKTLQASKIMSKPPAFAVLNVNDLLQKTTTERVVGLDDMALLYKALAALSETTDALIRLPVGSADDASSKQLQAASVQLCQNFQAWQSSQTKVNCSCPEMHDDVAALHQCLEALVSETSVRVWQAAMTMPTSTLTLIVTQQKPPVDDLQKALGGIPDAKLLATGPQDRVVKEELNQATCCVEQVLTFAYYILQKDDGVNHAKAMRVIFEYLKALDVAPKDIGLNEYIAIAKNGDETILKCLGPLLEQNFIE